MPQNRPKAREIVTPTRQQNPAEGQSYRGPSVLKDMTPELAGIRTGNQASRSAQHWLQPTAAPHFDLLQDLAHGSQGVGVGGLEVAGEVGVPADGHFAVEAVQLAVGTP